MKNPFIILPDGTAVNPFEVVAVEDTYTRAGSTFTGYVSVHLNSGTILKITDSKKPDTKVRPVVEVRDQIIKQIQEAWAVKEKPDLTTLKGNDHA